MEHPALVAYLLEHGADPNTQSNTGQTPLSFAIARAPRSVVELLLGAKADVAKGDPLHCAVVRQTDDCASLIHLLIQLGASPNTHQWEDPAASYMRYDLPHQTPLHKACYRGNREAVEVLLAHGADPAAPTLQYGKEVPPTPLDVARKKGDAEIISWLEDRLHEKSSKDN